MDDLLREFLTETGEHLDTVDVELVRLERHPGDEAILRNVFRLIHTIKGTCGFLGLPRLEALAHAAETLMGQLRRGAPVTSDAITLILATIDRIKLIMSELERVRAEPVGSDADLIYGLRQASVDAGVAATDEGEMSHRAGAPEQVLLRPLRTGEVPLHVLETAFRQTPGPEDTRRPDSGRSAAAARPPAGALAPAEPDAPARAAQTVRVAVGTLENLMAAVSELVLTRNQLLDAARRSKDDGPFRAPLQRLSKVTAELQTGIVKARMQPVGSVWSKLPRLLRDLSAELGKEVELATRGAETELDRQVLEAVRDPLIHLVRNAAGHGIESPAERMARGKPERGTITLRSYHEGGAIVIEVADDGRGLDHDAVRSRAVETRLVSAAEAGRMTDAQAAELIFHPGFTTTKVADSVSGRGVGLDVVKSNVELIGGSIEVASERGVGSTFRMKLPLTLAIDAALIVRSAGQRFAIPHAAVGEILRVRPGSERKLDTIDGTTFLRLRGELLPVLDLGTALDLPPCPGGDGYVVVAESGRHRLGLLVEAVIETEEIVVKPMPRRLRAAGPFSGNTILGDGAVALILDPNAIARRAGIEPSRRGSRPGKPDPGAEQEETVPLLVFRGGDGVLKAMPLSLVSRLEEIDADAVERVGGRAHVQYRGGLMPLLPVDDGTEIRCTGAQSVVVVAAEGVLLGVAVNEVVDVVAERIEIREAPGRPDLVGTAIVRGRATEIVDIADYVPRAGTGWLRAAGRRASEVLLVESSAFFRDMLIPVLRAAGHAVRVTGSADEAAAILAQAPVDATIVDLDLPDGEGLRLLASLRGYANGSQGPLVAIASRPDSDTSRRAQALCGRPTVAKFDRASLVAAVSEAAERLARELAA